MAFAILRFEKIKDRAHLAAAVGHQSRSRETPNADPEKTPLNAWLKGRPDQGVEGVYERIGDRKVRKNAVLAVECLLTASPEYFRPGMSKYGEYEEGPVQDFNIRAMSWLRDTFGEQNIISAVCHLDEATPHIHAVIVPIDSKDKLNSSAFIDGKKSLSDLQTTFANTMKPLGLKRGVEGSKATHTEVSDYYGNMEENKKKVAKFDAFIAGKTPPLREKTPPPSSIYDNALKSIENVKKPLFGKISYTKDQVLSAMEKTAESTAAHVRHDELIRYYEYAMAPAALAQVQIDAARRVRAAEAERDELKQALSKAIREKDEILAARDERISAWNFITRWAPTDTEVAWRNAKKARKAAKDATEEEKRQEQLRRQRVEQENAAERPIFDLSQQESEMKDLVLEKASTDAERTAVDCTIERILAPKGHASTDAGRSLAAEEKAAHARADAAFDASVDASVDAEDGWDGPRM